MDLDGQESPQRSLFQPWMCFLYSTLPSLTTKTKATGVQTLKTSTKCFFLYFILKDLHRCIAMLIFRGELPFSNAFAWLNDPSERGLNFDRLVTGRPKEDLNRQPPSDETLYFFLKQWFCESDACRWPGRRDILTQMTFWDANDLLDDRRALMRLTQ